MKTTRGLYHINNFFYVRIVNGVFAKKFKMILNAQINCVLGQCFTDTEFLIGSNTRSAVILLILLKMLTL